MPIAIEVTHHAVQRYQERVADVPAALARAVLSTRAIQTAADFGAKFVKLGTGHRAVIESHRVVTVLPKEHPTVALRPDGTRTHPAHPDAGLSQTKTAHPEEGLSEVEGPSRRARNAATEGNE